MHGNPLQFGRGLVVCLAAVIALACRSDADEPREPVLEVQLQKPGDTATIRQESGRHVITVTSESGIGRMTVTAQEGRWPADVSLRLRYRAGREQPFKTLEGLECRSSRLQVRCNSGQSGKAPFFLADDAGKFSRDDVNPSGWLNIPIKPHDTDLQIDFPAHLWRGEKEVQIQWIDFYRG